MHLMIIADVVPNGACSAALIAYSHQNPAFYTREKAGFVCSKAVFCLLKDYVLYCRLPCFTL